MEVYCTRPRCPRPLNSFPDLDQPNTLRSIQQKYCTTCGMELILAGRYVPLRLLGQGGFGAAFLARDRYTPAMRQCVVKQFQPASTLTPDQLQIAQNLFEREGQVLEELGTHPQIPDLLAFFALPIARPLPGEADQFFYLVQEFIDGHNLEQELEQQGRFSEAKVLELLERILPVLQFVHDHGSIHRDIKPSNIMRRRDGLLFLLDFGAVKQVASSRPGQGGKNASTGIYSIGFAPPEQMQGDVVYPATDLYALAVTCLMLLTDKQPKDFYDSYSNTWNWRAYAQVSDRLEAVLNRMLLPSPSQRFQSATEVLAALKPAVMPAPPPTPAPTPTPQPSKSSAKGTALQPTPQPSTPQPSTPQPSTPQGSNQPQPPAVLKPARPPISTLELLYNAAFTGFEGGLLTIGLASLLATAGLVQSIWVVLAVVMTALIFAQWQRWIERVDLILIAGATFAAVLFVSRLRYILTIPQLQALVTSLGGYLPAILLIAGLTALGTIVVAILFRLIYKLLSRLF